MAGSKEKEKSETKAKAEQATETPEFKTEEWIYTERVDTGEVVKVEKLDKETGQRQEVALEEHFAGYYAPQYAFDPYGYDPYGWAAQSYASLTPGAGYGTFYDPYGQVYAAYGYDPYSPYAYPYAEAGFGYSSDPYYYYRY